MSETKNRNYTGPVSGKINEYTFVYTSSSNVRNRAKRATKGRFSLNCTPTKLQAGNAEQLFAMFLCLSASCIFLLLGETINRSKHWCKKPLCRGTVQKITSFDNDNYRWSTRVSTSVSYFFGTLANRLTGCVLLSPSGGEELIGRL